MLLNRDLYLIGAGGTTKNIIDIINRKCYSNRKIYILDDDENKIGKEISGIIVKDNIKYLEKNVKYYEVNFINCIGSTHDLSNRNKIYNYLKNLLGCYPESLVSDTAILNDSFNVGIGVIIMDGVIINNGSIIGHNSLLNTGTIIEHDCKIGYNFFTGPGCVICGNVTIGNNVFVGAGSTIIGNIKIGDNVEIGAGSVIIRDVDSNCKLYGNPAHKNIKYIL